MSVASTLAFGYIHIVHVCGHANLHWAIVEDDDHEVGVPLVGGRPDSWRFVELRGRVGRHFFLSSSLLLD